MDIVATTVSSSSSGRLDVVCLLVMNIIFLRQAADSLVKMLASQSSQAEAVGLKARGLKSKKQLQHHNQAAKVLGSEILS